MFWCFSHLSFGLVLPLVARLAARVNAQYRVRRLRTQRAARFLDLFYAFVQEHPPGELTGKRAKERRISRPSKTHRRSGVGFFQCTTFEVRPQELNVV